jgi:hypothetical protein
MSGKTVSGGAVETQVTVAPLVPDVEGEDTLDVIVLQPGTLGPEGIIPVGTKMTVRLSQFSKVWMRPGNAKSAMKVKHLYPDAE